VNAKQRLRAVNSGEKSDRLPFMPTILEHSAAIIGKTPSETAMDTGLLEAAHLAAYEKYKHDALTIGIDVYNIEAEALGCKVRFHNDNSIPGIFSHPLSESFNIENLTFSTAKGRISKILDAAKNINGRLVNEVNVGVGISGPFSISAELYGFENMIADCIDGESKIIDLLSGVLEFQKCYCDEIINHGLGITMFESWATPPLVSPGIYAEYVAPYEKEIIEHIKSKGTPVVPLVIGGDTSEILDDMLATGTTLIIADFEVDIELFLRKASKKEMTLRGNIDPKLVESGTVEDVIASVDNILQKVKGYNKFILGTGVVPYGTPPENILAIKSYLEHIGNH